MSVSSVSDRHVTPPAPTRQEEKREVQGAERDTKAENKSNEDKEPVAAPAKPPQSLNTSGVGQRINTTA